MVGDVDRLVPGLEGVRVEDELQQVVGAPASLRAHSLSSHSRTDPPCWSSRGGATWSRRVVSVPSGAKNRSGPPGSVTVPSVGCSTSSRQPLAGGLVPGVDLVQGAHLAGRYAELRQLGQQRLGVPVGEDALEHLDHPLAGGDPLGVGGQARRGRVESEPVAQPLPQPLAADRDLHEPVAAVEQAVRRDRRVVVALRAADLARDRPAGALERVHADDRGEQRGPHDRPDAGALALVQRREDAVRAVHPGEQVGDGRADALRVVRAGAGE